jgi:nucleotide-binding universal stress UspA family protein
MIRFNRILFPVDLSKQSRETVPFVTTMAARFDSRLLVLHVLDSQLSYYPIPAAATPAALQRDMETRENRRREFDSFVTELCRGVSVEPRVLEGDATDQIVSCAKDNGVDLIMMPTHGFGRFRQFLLGSVTAKVLHDVACPVWTGAHMDEICSHIGRGWGRFLCAVDEDVRDASVLKWAAQFASEQGADLQVVHAVYASAPLLRLESDLQHDVLFDVACVNLEKLQAVAGTKLDIRLRFGPVGDIVREAALEGQADLILIGRGAVRKGFGRLRSNAYAVIREAPCPVISL